MNTPHDPHEPLLQSLAEEAAELPLRAAREARSRNTHHMRQRFRVASAVTILFVAVCSWSVITAPTPHPEFAATQPATPESAPEKPSAPLEPIAPIAPASPTASEAPGFPSHPMSRADVEAKALGLMAPRIGEARATAVITHIAQIETMANGGDLAALIAR